VRKQAETRKNFRAHRPDLLLNAITAQRRETTINREGNAKSIIFFVIPPPMTRAGRCGGIPIKRSFDYFVIIEKEV